MTSTKTKPDRNVVLVSHGIGTQPGIVRWEEIFDPKEDSSIQIQGERVTKYPAEPDFKAVTLKVGSVRLFKEQLTVGRCELVNRT
ncbi:MAG: hypothetical protein AAGJ81_06660 [Verrucomicrobiota bacterium]